MGSEPKVWADEWTSQGDEPWEGGARSRSLARGAARGVALRASAGHERRQLPLHHGTEELLLVLKGRPRLRTPAGERDLDEGAVVLFARGADGAHRVSNPTQDLVRYVMVSTRPSPDAVEYPDARQLSVMAFTKSQLGSSLWDIRTLTPPEAAP